MKSVARKLMAGVSLLFLSLILLIYWGNLFFLDDYYQFRTKGQFEEESRYLTEVFKDNEGNFQGLLQNRSPETGMKYIVSDRGGLIHYNSIPEFRTGGKLRLPRDLSDRVDSVKEDEFYGIIERENSGKKEILLISPLSHNRILLITTPLEHLKTNARIANQFLLIIGSMVFLISLIITWYFTRTVVRPVKELTRFSERIEHLDFSQPYENERDDEIGRLGTSLNRTADTLEKTIGDLKEKMVLQKRFLASISHELKSPVALIRGYSEALELRGAEKEEREEYIGIITAESDRLNLLINDLLQLERMEQVDFSLVKEEFDLAETIQGIVKKHELLLEKHRLSLEWNPPEKIFVQGDVKRLTQAVDNLLNNAIKHCPDQGSIKIDLAREEDRVSLNLFNEGEPIPEPHLDHLFEPFYSAHEDRERGKTGSGLGLSIVQRIVEKHGGSCLIENATGGVRVSLVLPY
ncbi:MAG: HAMP domain-containing sensor histidine kinase [Spirochaetales bacterium]|nr:HAMP domain-containing sensor histidine kinase [Spirochaetales bacterium]